MEPRLRQLEKEDLPRLRDWRNSGWLRPYLRQYQLLNMVNQCDWFSHISRSREVEMFGIDVDGSLVGVCGLCHINWVNRTAEVSFYISPMYQSKGIGRPALELLQLKAFEEFNLHRLWVEAYEFHEINIRLFEDAGFQLEGRLHEHVFKLGKYHDSLMYGLLRG